jgi:hypothetical protein
MAMIEVRRKRLAWRRAARWRRLEAYEGRALDMTVATFFPRHAAWPVLSA